VGGERRGDSCRRPAQQGGIVVPGSVHAVKAATRQTALDSERAASSEGFAPRDSLAAVATMDVPCCGCAVPDIAASVGPGGPFACVPRVARNGRRGIHVFVFPTVPCRTFPEMLARNDWGGA